MRGAWLGAALLCTACAGERTRTRPADRPHHVAAVSGARMPWVSERYGVALDRPVGRAWREDEGVAAPEGAEIPLVLSHVTSGAQVVVQVAEPVAEAEPLARMLRRKLETETTLAVGPAEALETTSGSPAFGFPFEVRGEASGRVAVIQAGGRLVLVVASWPQGADRAVVREIDALVGSVRPSRGSARFSPGPDKT